MTGNDWLQKLAQPGMDPLKKKGEHLLLSYLHQSIIHSYLPVKMNSIVIQMYNFPFSTHMYNLIQRTLQNKQ